MTATDMDLIERIVSSSPPLLLLALVVVVVLWRKLEQREARMDALADKTTAALADVGRAIDGLTAEIRGKR